jgi:hypothetical protein
LILVSDAFRNLLKLFAREHPLRKDAPVDELLLELVKRSHDPLPSFLGGNNLGDLVVVEHLRHHLSFRDSLVQHQVHRAVLLRHKLLKAIAFENTPLKAQHGNDNAYKAFDKHVVRLGFKAFELLWVTNERLIVEVLLILALPNLADTDLVVKGVWKELR